MTVGESQVEVEATDVQEIVDRLFEAERTRAIETPLKRPAATYRLQLNSGFRFADADRIVDYLAEMGISDVYLSPYLAARRGSTHGYDVIDHTKINPEIGSPAEHAQFLEHLKSRGMGRVLDIVPNHTGFSTTNPLILDLLENGPDSRFAPFFDVDWNPGRRVLEGRILLPILEDVYGNVLESGAIHLEREGGQLWLVVDALKLPLRPRSYGTVMRLREDEFAHRFKPNDPDVQDYMSIIQGCRFFPKRGSESTEETADLRRETIVMKRRLERLCEQSPRLRAFLDENLRLFSGTEGDPQSFDALHELVEAQVYRLAYWRVASEEINYRRFFDVTDLAGIRVEVPEVFDYVHRLIFKFVDEGGVTALRIDHPDGLADPLGYFERLQERLFLQSALKGISFDGDDQEKASRVEAELLQRFRGLRADQPDSPLLKRFPVVVEKILSSSERLPPEWPIDGTVGYEYLNVLNGVFVNADACKGVDTVYRNFTEDTLTPQEMLRASKVLVARSLLSSEFNNLAQLLSQVAESSRSSRDFTLNDLRRVLVEVVAGFPVYRTYYRSVSEMRPRENNVIDQAISKARRRLTTVNPMVFSFVRDVLRGEIPPNVAEKDRALWEHFVTRFQQTTGPVQAKGLEDTTFYRQVPLVSINEVGGDPSKFGVSPALFHQFNIQRLNDWPGGLATTATHDTKRGEDARIRINVISELVEEWMIHINRWSRWNDRKKVVINDKSCPDACEEYLLYQTLIGAMPFDVDETSVSPEFIERIQHYMEKAASEAKRNTNWTDPDPSYKQALAKFVGEVLGGSDALPFLKDFLPFQQKVARIALNHSLSQVLLKIGSPGVADIYQGCERWDFNLVDPDNRRPVDFEVRRQGLEMIQSALRDGASRSELAARLYAKPDDGLIKQYLVWVAMNDRKRHPNLYLKGQYRPIEISGPHRDKIVSFARTYEGRTTIVVGSRLLGSLMGEDAAMLPLGLDVWGETELNLPDSFPTRWINQLDGTAFDVENRLRLGDLFGLLPVAWLTSS